jgi:hypothetical protein
MTDQHFNAEVSLARIEEQIKALSAIVERNAREQKEASEKSVVEIAKLTLHIDQMRNERSRWKGALTVIVMIAGAAGAIIETFVMRIVGSVQ